MISKLQSLPAMPKIAREILALKINTEKGERELYGLIEKDPVLMSRIIGLSNSTVFTVGRKILSLHEAKAVLGSKRVKMTAMGFAMMSTMAKGAKGLLDIERLWKHSLYIAMTMETLAKFMPADRRPPEDEIYLAGLLHDIGFLVLNHLDAQLCDQFFTRLATEQDRTEEEIEAEVLSAMNHCVLGAELGSHWALPENIIAVLRYHHANECPDAQDMPLVLLSYLADKFYPAFGNDEFVKMEVAAEELAILGINPLMLDKINDKVQMHSGQLAEMNS